MPLRTENETTSKEPKRPNPSAERTHQQRQQVSTLAETQLTQWVGAETSDYAASLTKLDQQLTQFETHYAHRLVERVEAIPQRILVKTVELAAKRWGSRQSQPSELEQSFAAAIDAVELPELETGFEDFLHRLQGSDLFGSKLLGSAT